MEPIGVVKFEAAVRSEADVPVIDFSVHAGFPSPGEDSSEKTLDLNDKLVEHPEATFFMTVSGSSMEGAGIFDGDLIVVDRSLTPVSHDIVVARLDGELTLKFFLSTRKGMFLIPANPRFKRIEVKGEMELVICGVVTYAIKGFRHGKSRLRFS